MVTAPKFSSVHPSRMSFTPVPLKLFTVPAGSSVTPVPIIVPPLQSSPPSARNRPWPVSVPPVIRSGVSIATTWPLPTLNVVFCSNSVPAPTVWLAVVNVCVPASNRSVVPANRVTVPLWLSPWWRSTVPSSTSSTPLLTTGIGLKAVVVPSPVLRNVPSFWNR